VIAAGGCALLIGAYLLMSLAHGAALIGGALLSGVGNGLMWPSYLVMLSHAGPARLQGTVQGVGSSAGSLASIFGTLAGGVLFVTIGVATMYVSAAAIAIATGMFFGVTLRTPRIAPDLAQPVPERPPRVRPVRGTTSQAGSGATSRPGSRARTRAGSEDARARWHA
jgi:MFS family permease